MATGFDKFLSKPLPTTVKPTEHGLRTIIRRWEISAEALRVANADTNAFPDYETPDEEYTSALLVEQSTGDGTAFGVKLMYWRVYQELPENVTDLVQLGKTVFSTTENGLQTAEQRFVARAGHELTGDVGTDTYQPAYPYQFIASGSGLNPDISGREFADNGETFNGQPVYLSEGVVDYSLRYLGDGSWSVSALGDVQASWTLVEGSSASPAGSYTSDVGASGTVTIAATVNPNKVLTLAGRGLAERGRVTAVVVKRWAEPGILNKSESSGPASLPGTIRHTWECFVANPAIAVDMGGAANTIPGILTGRVQSNVEGIPTWRYTSIAFPNAPTDGKYLLTDYYAPRNITRPGRVAIGLHTDASGDEVPYLKTDPKSGGREDVKVNIYVTTTKPTKVGTIAETLKGLRVGVTHLRSEIRPIGSDSYTSPSGNLSASAVVYRRTHRPSYKAMTGYYIDADFGTGVSGTTYVVTYPASIIRDGDNIVGETISGTISETYTLEGSGSADAPAAVGTYDRGIGVAFTALDGTIYYVVEEIELEAAA